MIVMNNILPWPAAVAALFLLLCGVVHAEFNFEVGRRVSERVSSFLGTPTTILQTIDSYRSNEAFPYDMGAPDRNAFFKLNDAFMETFPQFQSIYYGLEDGVFAGHGFASKIANYREPGHSGYLIADDLAQLDKLSSEDLKMAKHFMSCVNATSGGQLPCKMSEGVKYTECTAPANEDDSKPLFDCVLEKCADENSQRDCDAVAGGNETELLECQGMIKWCSSYVIKEAPANKSLGYVPRSTMCIDHTGVPSQTRGEVQTNPDGNCYYEDGVTLVENNLEGAFAYCGGDGKVCSDTFVGAYKSRDYDPRWRGWYIETKAIQKPNWSPPYPFFTSLEMGITFSLPIYSMQDELNVFAGVLAVDYTFTDISNFLQDNYKDSPTIVAIFEQDEPHYMVASSTGSNSAKVVLVDDESTPCPNPEIRDGSCKAVRIPAAELSENDLDRVISRAFLRQQEKDFPEGELISARDENTLYATQTKRFSIEDAELDWYIMIMTPVETEVGDTITQGEALFGALIAVATLGFIICSVLVGLMLHNRKKREVIVSDWRFMCAFVGGCALLNAACLSFLGENTDELCLTRMWLVHWFIVFALSFLFVKTYRMYRLVGAGAIRATISHGQAARMTLPLIFAQTLILLIFTFVDPNKRTEQITNEGSEITHRYVCDHDTPAFFIVMLIYEGGLILVGCVLAFKTRHLRDEFNESKQIILSMYDTLVIGSVLLIVANVVVTYQGEQRMLFTVGIFWISCFASCVFVLPRLLQVKNRAAKTRDGSSGVHISGVNFSANRISQSALSRSSKMESISERQTSNGTTGFNDEEKVEEASPVVSNGTV